MIQQQKTPKVLKQIKEFIVLPVRGDNKQSFKDSQISSVTSTEQRLSNRVDQLEYEVTNIRNICQELSSQNKIETPAFNMSIEIKEKNQISRLMTQIEIKDKIIQKLTQGDDIDSTINNNNEEVDKLKQKLSASNDKITILELALRQSKAFTEEQQEEIRLHQYTNNELSQKQKSLPEEILKYQSVMKSNFQKEKQVSQQREELLRSELEEATSKIEEQNQNINALLEELQFNEQEITKSQTEEKNDNQRLLKEREKEINILIDEINEKDEEVFALHNELKNQKEQLKQYEEQMEIQLQQKADIYNENLMNLENQMSNLLSMNERLRQQCNSGQESEQVEQNKEELLKYKQSAGEMNIFLSQALIQLDKCKEENSDQATRLRELEEVLEEVQQQNQELRQQSQLLEDQNQILQQQCEYQMKQFSTEITEIEKLKENYDIQTYQLQMKSVEAKQVEEVMSILGLQKNQKVGPALLSLLQDKKQMDQRFKDEHVFFERLQQKYCQLADVESDNSNLLGLLVLSFAEIDALRSTKSQSI